MVIWGTSDRPQAGDFRLSALVEMPIYEKILKVTKETEVVEPLASATADEAARSRE